MKKTETFWLRDVIDIRVLSHFEFKVISNLYILNCLKYFLNTFIGANVPRKIRQEKNLNYVKVTWHSQKFDKMAK